MKKSGHSGYSKRTLVQKLGLHEDSRVRFINPPESYGKILGPLPQGCTKPAAPPYEFVQIFVRRQLQLKTWLPKLRHQIVANGMIWVSWPKKSSGVASDLNEDDVRRIALPLQLVDIKVCAVDEIWSGLKLVIRREHR